MVEACINDDSKTCREKDSGGEDEKRKGSVLVSMTSNQQGNEVSYLRKKWDNRWRLGTRM